MTNNALKFKRFLEGSDVYGNSRDEDNGSTTPKITQKLKCRTTANIIFGFSNSNTKKCICKIHMS